MRCDIIIPIWNRKELTSRCIDSIIKNTRFGYRIIAVDNASDRPTQEYLFSLKDKPDLNFLLIRNEENLGNTKAVNQGMKASDADFVCILDNDTVVAKGWLSEMAAIARLHDDIGIVSPSSRKKKVPESSIPEYVTERGVEVAKNRGQWIEVGACVGFCTLVKHKVIDKIGVWDEDFSPGYFDDTEYSWRANKNGFKSVIARGAYVYHAEHSSFRSKNLEKIFKRNEKLFYKKVGRTKRFLYVITKNNKEFFTKLKEESYETVNNLNWVTFFSRSYIGGLGLADHARIKKVSMSPFFFRIRVIFKVLVKKKKYTDIYVDDILLYRILKIFTKFYMANLNLF